MNDKLNRQVHRLLGKCSCVWMWDRATHEPGLKYTCVECGARILRTNKCPDYSTDLNHAWECITFGHKNLDTKETDVHGYYHCISHNSNFRTEEWYVKISGYSETDRNPATAICKAFVQAMGEEPAATEPAPVSHADNEGVSF